METKTIIIARSYSQELFYAKKFKSQKEAINYGERIAFQERGCVITYLKEKRNGHRWVVDVYEHPSSGGLIISTLAVNSKKSAKLAAESLKEYDDTLKIYINKIY